MKKNWLLQSKRPTLPIRITRWLKPMPTTARAMARRAREKASSTTKEKEKGNSRKGSSTRESPMVEEISA